MVGMPQLPDVMASEGEKPVETDKMGAGKAQEGKMSPVHFFSHGSTMMLGEESASARYWERMGDEAIRNGVEHVVIMGAHWATTFDGVLVSANPAPGKSPVAFVHPSRYEGYRLAPDLALVPAIRAHLAAAGIASRADPAADWTHDAFLVLARMFPRRCPPATVLSAQRRYDPHLHAAVGAALRPLRARGSGDGDDGGRVLLVGSGGAVHNLHRNVWGPMLRHRDNFAQPAPPGPWALDFRQEVVDALVPGGTPPVRGGDGDREDDDHDGDGDGGGADVLLRSAAGVGGPRLVRKVAALMKHPRFREAHGTDDHFMPCLFVAGLCGAKEDEDMRAELGAEDWELTNMCNSQFTIGSWDD